MRANTEQRRQSVGRGVEHALVGCEETVDMERACCEDDHPTSLFEEGCNHAVGSGDVDETEDEPEHQVGDAEVHREKHVLAER